MSFRLFRLAAVAAILPIPAVAAGLAGYVLYFQTFGDWSAICARDEAAEAAADAIVCTAESPAPTSSTPPAVVLRVTETQPGTFALSAAFRANVAPGSQAALRVDDRADHIGVLNADYELHFGAAESASLVAEMLAGRVLNIRAAGFGGDAQPIHVGVPLAAFGSAFDRMRINLRHHNVIRDSP